MNSYQKRRYALFSKPGEADREAQRMGFSNAAQLHAVLQVATHLADGQKINAADVERLKDHYPSQMHAEIDWRVAEINTLPPAQRMDAYAVATTGVRYAGEAQQMVDGYRKHVAADALIARRAENSNESALQDAWENSKPDSRHPKQTYERDTIREDLLAAQKEQMGGNWKEVHPREKREVVAAAMDKSAEWLEASSEGTADVTLAETLRAASVKHGAEGWMQDQGYVNESGSFNDQAVEVNDRAFEQGVSDEPNQ